MGEVALKVIIVEDEHLVRDLIKRCINWEEIGMSIVGEASNAYEAFELVDKIVPDIIFTDICMPFIDGLEFSKRVIEKYPHIKIIVLTGHEEFEYAKKSIKVGIADFLLKPINDEEIRKAAVAIKEKIIKENTLSEEYEWLRVQLQKNMPYLRERFFNELLQNSIDITEINEKLSYFGIAVKTDSFQVAVVEVFHEETGEAVGEEKRLLLSMLSFDIIRKFFKEDEGVHVFNDYNQRIVVLCNDDTIDLAECCESIKNMLINRLKCFTSIGIGNPRQGTDHIGLSYKEACDALNYRIIAGKNQVVHYADIVFSQEVQLDIKNNSIDTFSFFLKSGLAEKAEDFIEQLYAGTKGELITIEKVRGLACNILSAILNVLIESSIKLGDVFGEDVRPFEAVFKIDTLPEMKEFLKGVAVSAARTINSLQGKKVRKLVQDVQEYIAENFSDCDLSLSEVARKFFVNPSYLSRIFKQETGQTFIEYLMKLRMEKAVKLLGETDMKAYQIAEEVGINDPHYFSICFKKFTGTSVNEYRKLQ
jgi:two-component system response regulator YesN